MTIHPPPPNARGVGSRGPVGARSPLPALCCAAALLTHRPLVPAALRAEAKSKALLAPGQRADPMQLLYDPDDRRPRPAHPAALLCLEAHPPLLPSFACWGAADVAAALAPRSLAAAVVQELGHASAGALLLWSSWRGPAPPPASAA